MFFISFHKTNSAVSPDLTESGGVHVQANDKTVQLQVFPTRRDELYSREHVLQKTNNYRNITYYKPHSAYEHMGSWHRGSAHASHRRICVRSWVQIPQCPFLFDSDMFHCHVSINFFVDIHHYLWQRFRFQANRFSLRLARGKTSQASESHVEVNLKSKRKLHRSYPRIPLIPRE